jgi:hypothetical protein
MDLALYTRVLWRFRLILLAGLVLAVALSFLSFVRVTLKDGSPRLAYRQAELWQSQERLLITQRGFAEGWTNPPTVVPSSESSPRSTEAYVHFGRLVSLAPYYAQLANSDPVQRMVFRDPKVDGSMQAQQVTDPVTKAGLPVLAITGVGVTPDKAIYVTRRGALAFRAYLERQQDRSRIPPADRVQIRVLNKAAGAAILTPRKKTLPIMVFLTGLIATVGLAFILENLRPRIRLVEPARLPGKSDAASTG